jgi:transposase InsO family protein
MKTAIFVDKGKTRKVTPEELLESINQVLPYFREKKRYNKSDIYRKCIEKGILRRDLIGPTSFYRFIREYDLLNDKDISHNKRRLAFSMQYANQLWQADTMFGPYLPDNKAKMIQTKLIAFLDDASRVLCHGQFFFHENTDSLVIALKNAFYKRGIPEQMYVDQGSIYTSSEITLICARIGCILRHAPLRDAAAKGKIERFFRTVRGKFLNRNLDLSSLDILNKQFTSWVEDEYNASVHSSISMKPVDRFAIDLKRIKFLAPNEISDEFFYAEDTRKIKKDNTFSFDNIRYESPVDLRDRQINIRFDRHRRNKIIVYYKGSRMGEAKKLDPVANAKMRNPEVR